MKHSLLETVLVLVITVQTGNVYAKRGPILGQSVESLPDQKYEYVEGAPWKEIDIKIPSYPDDGDLIELKLDGSNNRFTYYMDEASLSVSEKDYVVRYTLVIESKRRTRNVFYEGMRCNTLEYKTYAFGIGKGGNGKFRPSKKPEWKSMRDSGYQKLRMDLMEFYLCDERRLPRPKETILTRIKYPAAHEEYHDAYNR